MYVRCLEDEERDVGVTVILVFKTGEAFGWVKEALKAEGVSIKHAYGGKPVYMNDVVLQKRVWHNGPSPWDPKLYDGEANYGPGLCPETEEVLTRVGEYQLSLDWSEEDGEDVARGLHKVLRALPGRVGR